MFGHRWEELQELRKRGYDPRAICDGSPEIALALNMIERGYFHPQQPQIYVPIVESLLKHGDHYMVIADFESYLKCQANIDATWSDQHRWTKHAILNVAQMGEFSADRMAREYSSRIWHAEPIR
jgi:starch phosphorylase